MADYSRDDLRRIGEQWLDRIKQAEKRENKWIRDAKAAEAAYLADDESGEDLPSFNILHSNVETIVPSIFNSTPSPDIRPRYQQKDPVVKVVADIIERAVSTQVDDNALDQEVEASAQDAFMAGRGIVRVRFDADEVPAEFAIAQVIDPDTGDLVEQEIEVAPARLANERVLYEVVSWRDYREGPAKRWDAVPWVAYRHEVSDEERKRLESEEVVSRYEEGDFKDEDKDCSIWEIWEKDSGSVFFVVEETSKVLDVKEDPLQLSTFFPQAAPVQPITGTGKRCPVCPYAIYKKLAQELDTATARINAIMKGLKVRGVIAGDASVLDELASAGDNELVTVQNIENLIAAGGLEKAVMWWPIETAVAVLRELYAQREQTKQAIYEITGISDIIRGQGAASETATAQQIKTEWGALRVKKMQRLIERQVRDLFKLTAEIITLHFSAEGLSLASGMDIPPEAQQYLQKPLDHYRIDVESDSTVRADLTKGRQEMAQFLEGTAQFFNTMAPVIGQAPQAAGPIVEMYASFARQFNLGKAAEDALEQFAEMAKQASSQTQDNPEQEAKMAEMQAKMQEMQGKFALEVEKLKLQSQNLMLDGQIKQAELQIKNREAGIKEDQLQLEEAKATVDAAAKAYETTIEQEQERPVKIG